jgi:hypothetical protein
MKVPFGHFSRPHYALLRQKAATILPPFNLDGCSAPLYIQAIACLAKFQYAYRFACGEFARRSARRWKITEKPVKKKIRAIQYGIGPIGASIAKLLREKDTVQIVGAIDNDPAKIGRDLGEVIGASDAPWGVKVSGDARGILEQSADIVMHTTSSSLPKVMDQLLACLDVGSCVVSTCEELSYPYRTYPELASKLDAAAKESGVALVGTGVNPGFVMDKMVITLAAVSQRIEHAKALRIVDAAKRRLPLQKKIGAGMAVEEFRAKVKEGVIKHVGLPESVAMIKELIYLELQMYVGAKDPADTIELTGHPNISLIIPNGSHGDIATASVAVNSIPAILEAQSGLRTSRDLPIGFFPPRSLK